MEEAIFIITHLIMAICGTEIILIVITSAREKKVPIVNVLKLAQVDKFNAAEKEIKPANLLKEVTNSNTLQLTTN